MNVINFKSISLEKCLDKCGFIQKENSFIKYREKGNYKITQELSKNLLNLNQFLNNIYINTVCYNYFYDSGDMTPNVDFKFYCQYVYKEKDETIL